MNSLQYPLATQDWTLGKGRAHDRLSAFTLRQ